MADIPVQVLPPTANPHPYYEGSVKRAGVEHVRQLHASGSSKPSHARRRIFIGPMPERIVVTMENEVKKKMQEQETQAGLGGGEGILTLTQLEGGGSEEGDDDNLLKIVRHHARRFVGHYREEAIAKGATRAGKDSKLSGEEEGSTRKRWRGSMRKKSGKSPKNEDPQIQSQSTLSSGEEDWNEDYEEQNIAEELLQRWRESEWGKAWKQRRSKKKADFLGAQRWFGGSFEIGTLLGVNLLNPPVSEDHQSHRSGPGSTKRGSSSIISQVSSPCGASGSKSTKSAPELHTTTQGSGTSLASGAKSEHRSFGSHIDSKTGLLTVPSQTGSSAKVKGKQRAVHYADYAVPHSKPSSLKLDESAENEPSPPVPPQVVLSRTTSQLDPTSSQAAMLSPAPSAKFDEVQRGEVIMRDRMLVRISYCKRESLSVKFDDSINRTTRDLQYEASGEFMVVWRKDFLEIYEDHSVPGRELLSGHKHLAHVIPLKASRTNLSVYSFVDLTFCITCAPAPTHIAAGGGRHPFNVNRVQEGTNIFIFKHKSRTRSWDWIWELWRYQGAELPPTLQVHNPRLNSTVTIDIPYRLQIDHHELYAFFTRDNIVELCIESLSALPDWVALVEQEVVQYGKRLELCWRRDAHLDWVWLGEDVYGRSRPWACLAGLALRQSSRPASLELRLTSHAPTHYHLRNDTRIDEPPAIEGYVERIRPNTQTKQSLYLSTHDGLLFINHLADAYPPTPPGLALTTQGLDAWVEDLRGAENLRGANQVMHATGICDLRSVVLVRRAFQVVPIHMHKEEAPPDVFWSTEEQGTLDDEEDEGGDAFSVFASTATAGPGAGSTTTSQQDRIRTTKMRRCFELLLNSGHVVRFETYSRKVAIEWVNRLRALVGFWKHKKRINAKEEIELAQARRPRLTPQVRVCQKEEFPPEPPADMSAPYTAMDNLYNWCVIDGCQPITKASKMHMRKGLRGQYKLVWMALVSGHLVRFSIKPGQSMHMGSAKRLNLLDAYVISGYYAAMNLPSGQFKANAPVAPRRYVDGLETDDRDEDMLFMLWYRPHQSSADAAKAPTHTPVVGKSVPSLSAKHRMLVFRSRSRIERDAWCWALGTEIEKIARVQVAREEKLRDTGNLVEIK